MRFWVVIAGVLVLAPIAAAQRSVEKLTGVWSCSADFDFEVKTWSMIYLDGGLFEKSERGGSMVVKQSDTGVQEDSETTYGGVWSVRKDGKLVEQLKRILRTSFVSEGRTIILPVGSEIPDNSLDAGEVLSAIVLKPDGSFIATASDGIVTTCVSRKSL